MQIISPFGRSRMIAKTNLHALCIPDQCSVPAFDLMASTCRNYQYCDSEMVRQTETLICLPSDAADVGGSSCKPTHIFQSSRDTQEASNAVWIEHCN